MATRKEKKEEKQKALDEFRSREGFLPYYSDTFFERSKHFRSSFSIWILLLVFLIEYLLTKSNSYNMISLCFITVCLFLLYRLLSNKIENRMKRFGYQMEEDALIRMAWGQRKVIPYIDIQRTLMTTPVKMTVKAILIPFSQGYISFPYEVGIAKQQKHIKECYDALRNSVQYEMPAMVKENISYFDRMYAYNASFCNFFLCLCFSQFLSFVCNALLSEETFDVIAYIVPVILQCGFLAKMATCIRLGERNAKELQQKLTKYPRVTYKVSYYKNWQFILVAIVVIALNFLFAWHFWM